MDIIYSFGDNFYRSNYRDYEKFPLEDSTKSAQAKPKHQPQQMQQQQQKECLNKSNCVFCKEQKKEQKKRPLKSAIRRCAKRTDSISEEAEADEKC